MTREPLLSVASAWLLMILLAILAGFTVVTLLLAKVAVCSFNALRRWGASVIAYILLAVSTVCVLVAVGFLVIASALDAVIDSIKGRGWVCWFARHN